MNYFDESLARWGVTPRTETLDESVSAFGRTSERAKGRPAWRTGPPGELTEAEWDVTNGAAFGRKIAEADEIHRQLAAERSVIRRAGYKGWDWLRDRTIGAEAQLVESVRKRMGGSGTRLQESTATAMLDMGFRSRLTEAAAAPVLVAGRRLKVTLITPGAGSSGFYPAATLEAAARDKVFPKGLHCYIDHPSKREAQDRPERSVRDLAATLASDARWTGSALVAEANVLPAHAELITALEGVAGMSIRADGDVEMREVGGQMTRVVTRLVSAASVDFVTKAGRGGFFEVMEGERRWDW